MHFLCTFDIICLNEVKTPLPFTVPGYTCYRSGGENLHRGGCALLIRNNLCHLVLQVQTPCQDCVWLKLRGLPNFTLVALYIPPSDSIYHSLAPLTEIQAFLHDNPDEKILIIGDLNARFGDSREEFLHDKNLPPGTHYLPSADPVNSPNENARYVLSSLSSLLLINGLTIGHKSYPSSLTFRRGPNWISELDSCLVSQTHVQIITDFTVHQRTDLPSDHAPISMTLDTEATNVTLIPENRASVLGESYVAPTPTTDDYNKRPIRMRDINADAASQALATLQTPPLDPAASINDTINDMNNMLYDCALSARTVNRNQQTTTQSTPRWASLLESGDQRAIWRAVNWNGTLTAPGTDEEGPSDAEFKQHFESLLNPPQVDALLAHATADDAPYLPLTDDPIEPREVDDAVRSLKMNKSGGPSGVPPGLLKLLPTSWIIFISTLFTALLHGSHYPHSWCTAKLVTLFKKGAKSACDNYRGLSLMDSFAKLYDAVLHRRLTQWWKPDVEQAGSQRGRGCTEHLVALRLLIDFARNKRRKLYLIFVDFSKAYDRVPRNLLLQKLRTLGCGRTMANAIAATYRCTRMLLRSTAIESSIGVRQGSPTSGFLFTLVVNDLLRDLKEKCPPDDFLDWLHALMLMDDTILLATSRERALQKVRVLREFCQNAGMVINAGKTKFMVINGNQDDMAPLEVDGTTISNCDAYTYLGSVFTQDGSIPTAVRRHCKAKISHVLKYEAFVRKNAEMPFPVKKSVLSAAVTSSILYGCESWLSASAVKFINPLYTACVRHLLGVRKTTATDLCLIESGLPSSLEQIQVAQRRYFTKMLTLIPTESPVAHAWRIAREANTPAARYINSITSNPATDPLADLRTAVRESHRTKFITYRTLINPDLSVDPMYFDNTLPEFQRRAITRFRLSSHNLAVERGRWSRIPREQRRCDCSDDVQDEQHVVSLCSKHAGLRATNPHITFSLPHFFRDISNYNIVYSLIKDYI